jgi:hypothetical protein
MPPYPFIYFPTWGEFREQLIADYGVTEAQVEGEEGDLKFVFLKRTEGTQQYIHRVCVVLNDDERLSPHTMRNVLEALGISLNNFGFELG